jgi:hypothetical protein
MKWAVGKLFAPAASTGEIAEYILNQVKANRDF